MKIDFEFTTKYGVFRDALHLPDDHNFSDYELEAMKQARLDNWLQIIESPPQEQEVIPPPDTKITIAGEEYSLLEGSPPSGAKLIEVNGNWYFKV